jgi:hypothetical protein
MRLNTENLSEQLRAAIDILEKAAANRSLLAEISPEEYSRLIKAAGEVILPDPREKRRFVKARIRQRKAEKLQRQQAVLNQTGIREMRRRPVYNTPNPLPAPAIQPREVTNDPDFRDALEPQHCYICKQHYSSVHHFYDQLCPKCADLNFAKRTERADLSGRVPCSRAGGLRSATRLECGCCVRGPI